MNRPYIEVDHVDAVSASDPIEKFAILLRRKYGGGKQTEDFNRDLLSSLIAKGYIPKSSIVWHQDEILKIFDFKIGKEGKIEYVVPCRPIPQRVIRRAESGDSDIETIKNAITRSKKMAV
jgi:hypothetical protein